MGVKIVEEHEVCSHCIQIVANGECTCWDCSFEPPERRDQSEPMGLLDGLWAMGDSTDGVEEFDCEGCGDRVMSERHQIVKFDR